MKRIIVPVLLVCCFFLCGFSLKLKKEKPVIILSSDPVITQSAMTRTENIFPRGQRISFMFHFPEGFGDNVLRMTLYKLNEKTNTLGYEIVRSRDIIVTLGDKTYADYFVLYQPGIYQVQFIESRKPRRILAFARFKVQ